MAGICNVKVRLVQKTLDDAIKLTIKTARLKSLDNLLIEQNLEGIKQSILDKTESYIDSHRRRPSNEQGQYKLIEVLRDTAFIERTTNGWRLGIGNQDELDEKVPYWYIVNYGGIVQTRGFLGIFEDGAPVPGGGGYAFYQGGVDDNGRSYFMKPQKPIPPMHYLNYMVKVFVEELRRFKISKAR